MQFFQTSDPNLHIHNAMFAGTWGFVLRPSVMWQSSHILYQRFLPASKTQEGLHVTNITLTIVSGQYVCRENYGASPIVEIEVGSFDLMNEMQLLVSFVPSYMNFGVANWQIRLYSP